MEDEGGDGGHVVVHSRRPEGYRPDPSLLQHKDSVYKMEAMPVQAPTHEAEEDKSVASVPLRPGRWRGLPQHYTSMQLLLLMQMMPVPLPLLCPQSASVYPSYHLLCTAKKRAPRRRSPYMSFHHHQHWSWWMPDCLPQKGLATGAVPL